MRHKLILLNAVIAIFFLLSIFSSYELSKGSYLIELNFNHIKYNHIFFDNALRYERGQLENLNILKDNIMAIRQQPVDCLKTINQTERLFMSLIGTQGAIDICHKDIKDADRALAAIKRYSKGTISKDILMGSLTRAAESFRENSDKFEPYVKKTVDTLSKTLFILSILLGLSIFFLVNIITRAIKRDYVRMEEMSEKIQKLASFPEKNPHPTIEINEQFEATYANPAFKEQFSSIPLDETFKSKLQNKLVTIIEGTFKEKKSRTIEYHFENQWYNFSINHINFGNKAFIRIFAHNITDIKKAENAIQEAKAFQGLIMENIPDMLFVKDKDFKIIQTNPAFLNAYPEDMRKTIIGTTTLEKYSKEEAEEFLQHDKKALTEGYSETEETITFPDGKTRTLLTKKVRFENQNNKKFVLGIARDITIIKEAESALKESKERYEVSVKGSSVGLWDWDIKTDELFWSERFKEIVGISDMDFKPCFEEFTRRLHPEDKEGVLEALFEHIEKKTPYDVEHRFRRTDDTYVWLHARGQAVWGDDGKATRVAGSVDDITDIKKTAQDLIEVNAELEEFAYRTSHDLRSPIISSIALLGLSQSMINDNNVEEAQNGITHAQASLEKLRMLIDDILQLTVVRNQEEEEKQINVYALIDDSLSKLSNLDGFEKLEIKKDYQFIGMMTVKPIRLAMIIENLLSNAIKYQNPKQQSPFIKISSHKERNFFVLKVSDNGLGIPKDQQKDLFKMFKRFHPKVAFGSGLGLYLMKKGADALGATIEFTDLGQGTSFKLKIPLGKKSGEK